MTGCKSLRKWSGVAHEKVLTIGKSSALIEVWTLDLGRQEACYN